MNKCLDKELDKKPESFITIDHDTEVVFTNILCEYIVFRNGDLVGLKAHRFEWNNNCLVLFACDKDDSEIGSIVGKFDTKNIKTFTKLN